MNRTLVLLGLVLAGIVVLVGCWPVVQSQPPAAVAPASTATSSTTTPRSTVPNATEQPNGAAAARPTIPPAKPTAPSTVAAAAAVKPTTRPSPATNGAGASASPVAVVATAVAGLPGAAASPAVSTDARANPQSDILGVATSAVAVAEANATDQEAVALCGPGAILATRAGQIVGRQATVAIPRVAASYQPNTRGQPTFLNDAPYPNHIFTAVIWGADRKQFQPPPESWQGRSLCVTGSVELFQQRPQIAVSSPSQLRAAR